MNLIGYITVDNLRVVTRCMGSGIKGLKRAGIWDHNAWDQDQQCFHGIRDQADDKSGFRDQNSSRFWDQGSTFWVKIWNQLGKNIPRYDPVIC